MIEVKINGLFLTQSNANGVILKELSGKRTLPILIGEFEAQSIALGLEDIKPPRPITHDLTLNLLAKLRCKIERVVVTELKNNTYYAIIYLRQNGESIKVDSRPSDALALAVREKIPIFVEEEVMEKGAYSADEVENIEEGKVNLEADRLEKLRQDLQEAVDKEDYEKAAKIRDEIKRMDSRQ